MKTVLFVPGFQENITTRNYDLVMRTIKSLGYDVVFVPINWSRTTIESWVRELDEVYAQYDAEQTVLAGFSFGAMTALVSATKRNPHELWLFSLSPYFAEDLKSKNMKPTWLKQIGHRRVSDFAQLNFESLSKSIRCKTFLFAGQLEIKKWPIIGERSERANDLLQNSSLAIVQDAGHDVADNNYIQSILKNIG